MGPKVKKITLCIGALILAFSSFSCQVAREAEDLHQKSAQSRAPKRDSQEKGTLEKLLYLGVENATASSFDDTPDWAPKPDPKAAVDRDMLTRWSPRLGFDNEWIYFDFGKEKVISKIIIKWETAYAVDYEILISKNAKNWKRLVLMEGQDGGIDEIEFSPVKTRFVKIIGLKRSSPDWGFSMWEFEMYGPKSLNPDEKEGALVQDLERKKRELEKAMAELKTSPEALTVEEFHKGVVYTSWNDAELGAVASDLTLVYLRKLGVKHIAIMVPTYQDAVDSEEITTHDFPGGDTPMDESVIHAIKTCHLLGIKVMLKPHVDCIDGTMRTNIMPSEKWFQSYEKMILRYAKLARENNVEIFCVGTELENASFKRWEKEWRNIISSVKDVYKGYLTYSANWSEYENVSFWDLVDLIGIDAYFPLTDKNNPTKEELIDAWKSIADKIGRWLEENNPGKGVLFTELGYASSDGTNKEPWATLTNPEDRAEQADCLDAALTVLHSREWFKGMYLWQYFPQERWSPLGFPVKDKLAEEVLRRWYNEL